MEGIPLAEYGVAIFAIGALVFVIHRFLKHMAKKDEVFGSVINNHLDDAKKINQKILASNDKVSESHDRLESAITRLIERL